MTQNQHLQAFLQSVDYRDPLALVETAAGLEALQAVMQKRVAAKRKELTTMSVALREIADLCQQLRNEARRLRRKEDFEVTDFATANASRITGESPNPEVKR